MVSRSSNTMPASTPSWPRPRSAKPSCTTRSRSTPRRSPCTSCPTLCRTVTPFKLLGVHFDCKLRMDVSEVVSQASWKLTTILRARRFHDVRQLVCKCTSRRCSRASSMAPQQCITRPKPHWLESTLFRHGFFGNAVSQMKTRFYMSISPRWRHAETSRCLVCCTDRRRFFRNITSNTSGEPLRGESRRQSERGSIVSLL